VKDRVKFIRQMRNARALHDSVHSWLGEEDPDKKSKRYRWCNIQCRHLHRTLDAISVTLGVQGYQVYCHFGKSGKAGVIEIWQDDQETHFDLKGNLIGVFLN